jgi:hypothetical protein
MSESEDSVILRAYAEAKLAAFEKGLTGPQSTQPVLAATCKVATRVLGRTITQQHVESVIRGSKK